MFRIALVRLTLMYLVLIMFISAAFSIALYQVSTQELGRSLRRQSTIFQNLQPLPPNITNLDRFGGYGR